ncbi:MAG TPA: hypothetical protein VIU11_19695 [Nakamurella sp.]
MVVGGVWTAQRTAHRSAVTARSSTGRLRPAGRATIVYVTAVIAVGLAVFRFFMKNRAVAALDR